MKNGLKVLLSTAFILSTVEHSRGLYPLHTVIRRVDRKAVDSLVYGGIDINAPDNQGITPLLLAIKLSFDADLSLKNRLKLMSMIGFLVRRGANVNAVDDWGNTLLHLIARLSNEGSRQLSEDMIGFFVFSGAKINAENRGGHSALGWSVAMKKKYICEILINHGADVNFINSHGTTALHQAILSISKSRVELLVNECHAALDIVDGQGNTPLGLASQLGNREIIDFLTGLGANAAVDWRADHLHWSKDARLLTALRKMTPESRRIAILRIQRDRALSHLLTKFGGKALQERNFDFPRDALSLVLRGLDGKSRSYFFLYQEEMTNLLNEVIKLGNADLVRHLVLFHGANVKNIDRGGNTTLHRVVSSVRHCAVSVEKAKDVAVFLMDCGVDVNRENNAGDFALYWAVTCGYKGIVNFLISRGADINIPNSRGNTVLHRTIWLTVSHLVDNRPMLIDMVKFLINECDADFNKTDGLGNTPLGVAIHGGNREIIDFLTGLSADAGTPVDVNFTDTHDETFPSGFVRHAKV